MQIPCKGVVPVEDQSVHIDGDGGNIAAHGLREVDAGPQQLPLNREELVVPRQHIYDCMGPAPRRSWPAAQQKIVKRSAFYVDGSRETECELADLLLLDSRWIS